MTAQSMLLETAAVFEVMPKKVLSFALQRQLDGKAACIFENGTVAEKRGPLSWVKVL